MTPWTIWFKAANTDTWQALDRYHSLPTGHYHLAARLPSAFKRLAWRWQFYPQVGDIQYYDFQGQTDAEGLISLLDLTTVEPGTWQLIGRPDEFDELCGETWQIEHQFQITPSLASALMIPPQGPEPPDTQVSSPYPAATSEAISHQGTVQSPVQEEHHPAEAVLGDNETYLDQEPVPLTATPLMTLADPAEGPAPKSMAETPPFRSVNYVLELTDTEKAATYQVDITVTLDTRRPSVYLDLPNPRPTGPLLYRPVSQAKSLLPPKLSKV
ncbi:MAG: hypothetical protein RLZZ568_596 [Cyanobacteriota bacterium]|jgi:hypothetical protein